jgi:hypothetical protein
LPQFLGFLGNIPDIRVFETEQYLFQALFTPLVVKDTP